MFCAPEGGVCTSRNNIVGFLCHPFGCLLRYAATRPAHTVGRFTQQEAFMTINRSFQAMAAAAGVALALLTAAGAAQARSDVSWSVGIGVPGVVVGASNGGYYAPAPVYVAPRPVYYAPRPVYYAPPPPVVYAPPPPVYYYGGGYREDRGYRGDRHRHHRHHRGYDRD
jgi:hypothetical protein